MTSIFLKLTNFFNNLFFKKLNIKYLFFFYIFFAVVANYFYSIHYLEKYPLMVDVNGNYIISNIGFNFSDIILSLQSAQGIKAEYYGINYYVSRMPLLPILLFLIHNYITKNFILIHIIKNLFFLIVIFLLVYNFVKKKFEKDRVNILTFFFIFLIFYIPHNLIISLSTNFEEGFLNYFIIILFLILIDDKNKFRCIMAAIILSLIFFLKSSMFYLVIVISIAYFFIEKSKTRYLPIFFFLMSSILWGLYSYNYTKYFAFGTKNTSFNSIVLSTAYHKDFIETYPRLSPDIYQERTDAIIMNAMRKNKQLNDEWSVDQFIFAESKNFLINNPYDVFKSILKKISVIFWYPYKDSQWNEIDAKKLRFSNIPNKLIFITSIIVLISSLKYNRTKINLYYLLIIISYFFPYLVGFVYSRHATSIYMISHIYLLNFYLLKLKYDG